MVVNLKTNMSVYNQPPVIVDNVPKNVRNLSFKAENDSFSRQQNGPVYTQPPMLDQQAAMRKAIEEQKKAQKKQKLKQNLSYGLGIAVSLAFLAVLLPQVFRKGGASNEIRSKLEQEAVALKPKNVINKKERHVDCYSDEVHNFIAKLEDLFKRKDIELKGGKRVTYVQFQGPGGTGKTDSADLIGKKIIEMFPGSEYYVPDLSMLTSSSFRGQDVQMLSEYTTAICKRADDLAREGEKTGSKKYVAVFLDEYDKIAMEDFSHNKHDSNKTTGALKTLINELKERDNVIIMAATNYPELIEGAIDSRMAKKVLFDYLTPKQIITSITEYYKNLSDSKLICQELLDKNNPKMKEICDLLGKREHQVDFRKIFDDIIPEALSNSPDMGKIELKHVVEAITSPSISRSLNLTEAEIAQFKNIIA